MYDKDLSGSAIVKEDLLREAAICKYVNQNKDVRQVNNKHKNIILKHKRMP